MSTLYEVEIAAVNGPEIELSVRSLQPDSAPLYDTERFALALLCDAPEHESSRLGAELPDESTIAVSLGEVDPSPYVASVQLDRQNEEAGCYRIVMTSADWTEHLTPGTYDSVAWDEDSDTESVSGS